MNPPITPALALISPSPLTWNPLDDINKFSFSNPVPVALPLIKKFGVASAPVNNEAEPIINPPMIPPNVAVICPCSITEPSLSK